jgi:hypothetical protein
VEGSRSRRRTDRYLQEAETLAQQVNTPNARAMVALSRGIVAALAGEWRNAHRLCDQAETCLRNECTGALWELGTAHRFALWPLMFMGEAVEINRRLPRLLKEARERDDLYEETNLCLAVRTFVRLVADEPELAATELDQVMEKWSHQGFHVQHMNHLFDMGQISLYVGDGQTAWHRLHGAWPTLQQSHLLQVQQVRVVMLDQRARCALAMANGADSSPWLQAAQRDVRSLYREKIPWADPLAQLTEAAIVFRRGDNKRAGDLLTRAIAGFTATDMHLHAAVARRRLGQLLGGSQGRELAEKADEWMNDQQVRNPERMTATLTPGWNEKKF